MIRVRSMLVFVIRGLVSIPFCMHCISIEMIYAIYTQADVHFHLRGALDYDGFLLVYFHSYFESAILPYPFHKCRHNGGRMYEIHTYARSRMWKIGQEMKRNGVK